MAEGFSENSKKYFKTCDLAKSITGQTPKIGTQCWIFVEDETGRLNKQCEKCPYFNEIQKEDEIKVEEKEKYAVIYLENIFKNNRVSELKKKLDTELEKGKNVLLLDCSKLVNIPDQGLGVILRTFKTLKEKKGELFLLNPSETLVSMLNSTMLFKILPVISSVSEAEEILRKKEEEIKTGEEKRKAERKRILLHEAHTLRCWDFFKGHNPHNATGCAECHYKASGSKRPCWMVIGNVDGIIFEYLNEECAGCAYFRKFNPRGEIEELLQE